MHGLLYIVGHLLIPASLKWSELQTHTARLWFRPGRSLVAVPPPGPGRPWQRFRGCVPSPRDQQALEGPGTSVWGKFWGCTGRPRSGRPGGERGPQAPAGCNGATNHGRWQRPAGLASVCQSRVPGAGESEGSRRRAAEAPGRGEGHRAWSGYVLRVVWLSAHKGSSQGGLGALSGPRGPRLVWG